MRQRDKWKWFGNMREVGAKAGGRIMMNWKRTLGFTLAIISLQTLGVVSNELPLLTLCLGFILGIFSFTLLFPETEKKWP